MFGKVECLVSLVRMTLSRSPSSKYVAQRYRLLVHEVKTALTTKVNFYYSGRRIQSISLYEVFGAF